MDRINSFLAQPKLKSIRVSLEFAIARVTIAALQMLPLTGANALAKAAVYLLDKLLPRLRRIALRNLSFAYPHVTETDRSAIVDGVFRSIARILVVFARFPSITAENAGRWIGYQGLENYQAAIAKGKGVLVATAHFGNWEFSAFAHALMTEPMNVMVRPLDNPLIDNLVEARRRLSGNHLLQKKDAARSILKALRANEAVGILIDQNTTLAEGVFVDFFGKQACASSAFTKLAYHSQAAVVPGYAVWDYARERYTLVFEPEIPMTGNLQIDTQAVHSALEAAIRKQPDQWLWIHRRWKTRPPGEPSLY